jgi:hypothetical protein
MSRNEKRDQNNEKDQGFGDDQGTRVGRPNPEGDEKDRTAEHKGSYGGEKDRPRTTGKPED